MKIHALFLLVTVSILVACAPSDLSTEEGIKKFYCYKTGMTYEEAKDWICVERMSNHQDIIVIGAFAHDAGCMIRSLIVDRSVGDWKEMIPDALEKMGWAKKDSREGLLIELIHQLEMGWGGVIDERDDRLVEASKGKLFLPQVESVKGGYSVKFWVLEPAGMLPEEVYSAYHLQFTEEGELANAELTDGFVLEL